jgi:hypothetical protein
MSHTARVRPSDLQAFRAAKAHNRKHAINRLKNKKWPDGQEMYMVRIGADDYAYLVPPGAHDLDVMRKNDDLLPAALIGALVIDALHGHDALMLEGDQLKPVELKLALTYRNKYWITPRKAIYTGFGNFEGRKSCFRSDVAANYEIKHNLNSKDVSTYLVAIDKVTYEVIDCYMMEGKEVLARLQHNRVKNEARDKKISKIELKLNAFMASGTRFYVGEAIGVEAYEAQIRASAVEVPYNAKAPSPK